MNRFETVVVDTDYIGGQEFFTSEIMAIRELGGCVRFENYKSEEEIIQGCVRAGIVLCCGNPPMTENVLSQIPARLIIRNGIGVNSVDLEAAERYGKIVCNTPGFCTEELAMHASGLILASLRNIGYYNAQVKKGNWPKGGGPSPRRLSNLTVGLFGFGDSARRLAEIFSFGYHSRVIACDPFVDAETIRGGHADPVDFDQLLEQSDILSLHVPLTKETRHLFDRKAFAKMKRRPLLVNIARGGLVCEKDLAEALREGQLSGAALDVLETEPIEKDNPLLSMDQVILTPHSAFYGMEADENSHEIVAELIRQFGKGKIPRRSVVNRGVMNRVEGIELI